MIFQRKCIHAALVGVQPSDFTAAIQAPRCVLIFGNLNILISKQKLALGLGEHQTTEHGTNLNVDIFNHKINL